MLWKNTVSQFAANALQRTASKGEITSEFVKNIPQDLKLVGTIAALSKAEFLEGIEILKLIVNSIRDKYGS